MRLVYRDIRMVVNYKMNNFGERGKDKGVDRVASGEVRCYNFVWASTVNLQLLPAMLYFLGL